MMISKRIRLYPNQKQMKLFYQYTGTARFIYNKYLATKTRYYRMFGKTLTWKRYMTHITKLKKTSKYDWLNEIPIDVVKTAVRDVDTAYSNFFKGTGKFPRFKSRKHSKYSFGGRADRISLNNNSVGLYVSSLEPIKTKYKKMGTKIYNPRISFDNKYWYLSFSYEVENQNPKLNDLSIGIDLGIKELAVISTGMKITNINKSKRIKDLERRKRYLERRRSRKYLKNNNKTTNNIHKLTQKINLINRQLTNIRNTYIHNFTKQIIHLKPSKIVVEDLNVRGMMKNKHLSKSIAQAKFYEIRRQLEYKSKLHLNIELMIADRWFPSTQTCSSCGNVKKGIDKMNLKDRNYECKCGLKMDRDLNAAINLANYKD